VLHDLHILKRIEARKAKRSARADTLSFHQSEWPIRRFFREVIRTAKSPFIWLHPKIKAIEPWGIVLAVLGLIFSIGATAIEAEDRQSERIFKAWETALADNAAASSRRQALEYLNRDYAGAWCGEIVGILSEEFTGNAQRRCIFPAKSREYFTKISLEKADLSEANLSGADLSEADLSGANLFLADLSWAHLNRANLTEANLSGAYVSRADLSGANLSGAYLSGAYLSGADLSEADLSGARLFFANLTGAELFEAYVSRANLSGANLSAAYLILANLTGANLFEADLSGADLTAADLTAAYLILANLTGANLFEADLSGADLTGTNFSSADLSEARNLTQAQLDEACGTYTILPPDLTITPCPE
jgi:uncharacterized protein YjbI with pentapeptide repeats